ncbi:MAG: hypothetical protein ACRCZI_02745, partial [Cetobacterium sp.]
MLYTKVKEALQNAILKGNQKGAVDVADSIEHERARPITRPTLQASTATDAKVKEREDKEFEIEYKEDIKQYRFRKDNLEEGLIQAYGLIWSEYMTSSMISRIESLPNYSAIKGDTIALIKAIKAATHEAARAQYPLITMTDALIKFITFKQQDDMSLGDYIYSFKEYRAILETQMGTHALDYFVEQQADYKGTNSQTERFNMKKHAFVHWSSYFLLKNADQRKYGSLLSDLKAGFVKGRDKYPKTFEQAIDLLQQHHFDSAYRDHLKAQDKQSKKDKEGSSFAQKGGTDKS